jgi:hypothetical protein
LLARAFDHLLAGFAGNVEDVYWLAHLYIADKQFLRALNLLEKFKDAEASLPCKYLMAKAHVCQSLFEVHSAVLHMPWIVSFVDTQRARLGICVVWSGIYC